MYKIFFLTFVVLTGSRFVSGQSPFQFREAYLLEHRIFKSGESYNSADAAEIYGLPSPSLNHQFVPDPDDIHVYQSQRWLGIVQGIDRSRERGSFQLAERHYIQVLTMLRKVQGQSTSDVSLMLDHLGEFYLETRDFDRAYATFSEAVQIRRNTIDALNQTEDTGKRADLIHQILVTTYIRAEDPGTAAVTIAHEHLADMLTRLGQLDLARNDLNQANRNLAEAVALANHPDCLPFGMGLYAIYFRSLALEKQSKWEEAERLWLDSIRLRDTRKESAVFWEAQKEAAAFYARRGDFTAAGAIAQHVVEELGDKLPRQAAMSPFLLETRFRWDSQGGQYSFYRLDSDVAMSEILAINKWHSEGADAAAALLKDPIRVENETVLDMGSESERSQLIQWFQRRAYMHMSILLDGEPSQDRVVKAYQLLSQVKGRFAGMIGGAARFFESDRGKPNANGPKLAELERLGAEREQHSKNFLAMALDGKPTTEISLMENENRERILTAAITADSQVRSMYLRFSIKDLTAAIPAGAAFLDFVSWERMDRNPKVTPHREYGVFVLRRGQSIRYVRLGTTDEIDKQIDALKSGVISGRYRGARPSEESRTVSTAQIRQALQGLYTKVIAPLKDSLDGTAKLWIVPDGKISLAPLAALMDEHGDYLLQKYTITYMNSWRDIDNSINLGRGKTSPPVILANPAFDAAYGGTFGAPTSSKRPQFSPLPGSEQEAADVASALHTPKERIVTGANAHKWLLESLWSPQILHVATHSVPSIPWTAPAPKYDMFEFPDSSKNRNSLLQSVIAWAGANREQAGPEDGLLTGLEIATMHLYGTELVVLSSCESAQGTPVEGQGVMGLRAAFSMAGADTLLMTLWPVDDEAGRQFMDFFYSHLEKPPAAALRQAQLDMIAKTKYANPIYWSGYMLSGTWASEKPLARNAPDINDETFVRPTCLEFTSHQKFTNSQRDSTTIRMRIGGVVRRLTSSAENATYDVGGLGNELSTQDTILFSGDRRFLDPEIQRSSQRDWIVTLTMQHSNDRSGFYLRFGPRGLKPEEMRLITLTGSPDLFPTTNIPEMLPPLSSFKVATDSELGPGMIEKAGFCKAEP
jgi:CHAT domain-containing protein/tetratricopeptide (TPR) repeat protein